MSDAKPKRRVGRPLAITPEVAEVIFEGVILGRTWEDVAASAGVSDETIRRYRVQGEEDKAAGLSTDYVAFVAGVARARRTYRDNLLAAVQRGTDGSNGARADWRAAAFLLERQFREEFAEKRNVDVTTGGQPLASFVEAVRRREREEEAAEGGDGEGSPRDP